MSASWSPRRVIVAVLGWVLTLIDAWESECWREMVIEEEPCAES